MQKPDYLKELIVKATKDSLAHGFKGREHPSHEFLIKAACEVAEIVDAYKHNRKADINAYECAVNAISFIGGGDKLQKARLHDSYERFIKDSVQDEFADVVIYLLVMAGHYDLSDGIDDPLCEIVGSQTNYYNDRLKSCDSFVLRAGMVMETILYTIATAKGFLKLLTILELWMSLEGFGDIWEFVDLKMKFNRSRPYLHGIKGDPTA